jgi:predicted GNAT family acetyltransferase
VTRHDGGVATVRDIPEESRFVVEVEGQRAGSLAYRMRGDLIVAIHTEVDDAFEGQGLASQLAQTLLESARDAGLRVRPKCPFVKSYLDRHPEYQHLLEGA